MTIRQYAKDVGFKIVGKLRKDSVTFWKEYDPRAGEIVEKKEETWLDEAGNTYYRDELGRVCIAFVDGDACGVI